MFKTLKRHWLSIIYTIFILAFFMLWITDSLKFDNSTYGSIFIGLTLLFIITQNFWTREKDENNINMNYRSQLLNNTSKIFQEISSRFDDIRINKQIYLTSDKIVKKILKTHVSTDKIDTQGYIINPIEIYKITSTYSNMILYQADFPISYHVCLLLLNELNKTSDIIHLFHKSGKIEINILEILLIFNNLADKSIQIAFALIKKTLISDIDLLLQTSLREKRVFNKMCESKKNDIYNLLNNININEKAIKTVKDMYNEIKEYQTNLNNIWEEIST